MEPTVNRGAAGRQVSERRYVYRPQVLEELARHGVRPKLTTAPRFARDYVSDLYRYEIRRLRRRLLRGDFPRTDYNARVIGLRRQYPLLSVPLELWTEEEHEP